MWYYINEFVIISGGIKNIDRQHLQFVEISAVTYFGLIKSYQDEGRKNVSYLICLFDNFYSFSNDRIK